MELKEFLNITGLELTETQADRYQYLSSRAQARLERMLGWSLSQSDNFEEAGKLGSEFSSINQDTMNLDALGKPDEVENTWRIFPYSETDTNLRIDPCSAVYKVKAIAPLRGDDQKFVTLKDFHNFIPVVGKPTGRVNYVTYVQKCGTCDLCQARYCTNCALLAVDADWIKNAFPDDLLTILADIIVHDYKNAPSLNMDKFGWKSESESVDGHTVSRSYFGKEDLPDIYDPLQDEDVLKVIEEYIGPYSPLYKKQRVY